MSPSCDGSPISKEGRRAVTCTLLEQFDARPNQVVADMIRLLAVDAAWRAGAREIDSKPADVFLGHAAAPGDAFGRASVLVARLEVHPAIHAGRIEA